MRAIAIILWLNAVVFTVYGACFLIAPNDMSMWLYGINLHNPILKIDTHAVDGGTNMGFGLFIAWCASSKLRQQQGLVAVMIMMILMASGRAWGMLGEDFESSAMHIYLSLEIITAIISGYLLIKHQRDFYHPYY